MFRNLVGIEPLKLDQLVKVSSFGTLYLLRIVSYVMKPGVFSRFLEYYCDELSEETRERKTDQKEQKTPAKTPAKTPDKTNEDHSVKIQLSEVPK